MAAWEETHPLTTVTDTNLSNIYPRSQLSSMNKARLHPNSSHPEMQQNPLSVNHLPLNGVHHPRLPSPPSQKQRVTVCLPTALIERLRNAVYYTGHRPLASMVAEAIEDIVSQMEEVNGGAFPQRVSPLKRGRRLGTRAASPLPTSPRRDEQHLPDDSKDRAQILRNNLPDDLLQSLFAVGLNLEASQSTTSLQNGAIAETPLNQAIVQLNHLIHEIRGSVEEPGSSS